MTTRSSYATHLAYHKHPKLFICDICNNVYTTLKRLKQHMQWHIRQALAETKCGFCSKQLSKFVLISSLTEKLEKVDLIFVVYVQIDAKMKMSCKSILLRLTTQVKYQNDHRQVGKFIHFHQVGKCKHEKLI